MNLSTFLAATSDKVKNPKTTSKKVNAGKKTRRGACGGELEANDECGFKERESVSDAGFGCFIQPGELRNARSKFRSFRHREIDSAKSERCE